MNGLPLCTLQDIWANVVDKFPNKVAVISEGREYTYREIDALIARVGEALRARFGLARGERVAVAMPNSLEFFVAYWATVLSGGVIVPINTRLRAEEMQYVLENADARALIVHKQAWSAIEPALASRPAQPLVTVDFAVEGQAGWEDLLAGDPAAPAADRVADEDLAVIAYTSGTTGQPKGAMMNHGNILFNVRNCLVAHSFRHEDVHLVVVPMFHCTPLYSLMPSAAYLGSTLVIAPQPQISLVAQLIQDHRVTTFIGVPTLFHFLVTMRDFAAYDFTSLKTVSYAGATMPVQTIRRLRERLPSVETRNFFGLTETTSVTHVLPSCDALTRGDSVGKALPDVGVMIADEQGRPLPPGEIGELCIRRENTVPGYWGRPGLLEESIREGWFHTGDLAMVDDQGYLYLRGRSKDMIIVGGENVYANEVEAVLMSHGKVMECAVVGVEATGVRAYLGELVKAVVVPEEATDLTEAEVKRHCAQHLASYKVPQIVEFRSELPRNPSGKVLKRDLR
ncbi:MAG: long-chain fatty acid--CoA ligase [Armatimonadetes bacterium]|nr:long-chain fatty acid--CoA ligase [Armatimonadota bacterium]